MFLASCQYPPGMLDAAVAYRSLRKLAEILREDPRLAGRLKRLLLTGDHVYVDATAGLFDPLSAHDRYHLPYQNLAKSGEWSEVCGRVRRHVLIDDHEIADNWEPSAAGTPDPDFDAALAAFRYATGAARGSPLQPDWLWNDAEDFGGAAMFLGDSRTKRQPRTVANVAAAHILDAAQFDALEAWLLRAHRRDAAAPRRPPAPKLIATPSMLLPRRLCIAESDSPAAALRSDAWDGYPASTERLLGFIARHRIRNVIFLSGDEHLSCIADITLRSAGADELKVLSIHVSPLFAPYPFANAVPEDFAGIERFSFRHPVVGTVDVGVRTTFARTARGFASLEFDASAATFVARIRFYDGDSEDIEPAETVEQSLN